MKRSGSRFNIIQRGRSTMMKRDSRLSVRGKPRSIESSGMERDARFRLEEEEEEWNEFDDNDSVSSQLTD
jgi:hypothetical protein